MNAVSAPSRTFIVHNSRPHLRELLRHHISVMQVQLGRAVTVPDLEEIFLASDKQLYKELRFMTLNERYLHRTTANKLMAYHYDLSKQNPFYGKTNEELSGKGSHGGELQTHEPKPRPPAQDPRTIPGPWNAFKPVAPVEEAPEDDDDDIELDESDNRELSPLEQVLLQIQEAATRHSDTESSYVDLEGRTSLVAFGSDEPVRNRMFAADVHALLAEANL